MIFIHVFHDLILKCLYLNLFFFFSPSGPKYLVNYFPGGSDSKISAGSVGDLDLISGSGRSPGEENGYTPVFLPGELQGQRSLVGYSL